MRKRVVLVDEKIFNRKLIQDLLTTTTNLEIIKAKSSSETVKIAINQRPSLILLSAEMPDMSNRELYATLRQHPSTCNIPIITLTDQNESEKQSEFSSTSYNSLLSKPIGLKALTAKIQPYVDAYRFLAGKKAISI